MKKTKEIFKATTFSMYEKYRGQTKGKLTFDNLKILNQSAAKITLLLVTNFRRNIVL